LAGGARNLQLRDRHLPHENFARSVEAEMPIKAEVAVFACFNDLTEFQLTSLIALQKNDFLAVEMLACRIFSA
jgi:hypothetical protein